MLYARCFNLRCPSLATHHSREASEFSSFLFLRRPPGHIDFKEAESFFPTPYLIETFEVRRFGQLVNKLRYVL